MKIQIRLVNLFFILGMGLIFIAPGWAATQPQDGIMAVVNDDIITYRDLSTYLNTRYTQLKYDGTPDSEIKKIMQDLEVNGLKRLIEDKLVTNEANKKEIKVRKERVDKRLDQIKQKYPSEDVFIQALQKDGMTVTDLRKKIEDQLKVQELIEREVRAKVYVTPQDITDFYNKNTHQFKIPAQSNLDSIFVASGDDPAKAKEKIQKALDLVKSGKDFRSVAQEYSETPAIGIVQKGAMLTSIEDVVWKLDIGKCSDIVEANKGFYIFKILGKNPEQTVPLEDAKEEVQRVVSQEKFHQEFEQWINGIEKNAYIDIKE